MVNDKDMAGWKNS